MKPRYRRRLLALLVLAFPLALAPQDTNSADRDVRLPSGKSQKDEILEGFP